MELVAFQRNVFLLCLRPVESSLLHSCFFHGSRYFVSTRRTCENIAGVKSALGGMHASVSVAVLAMKFKQA